MFWSSTWTWRTSGTSAPGSLNFALAIFLVVPFNVTKESVVARQATIDPYHWPVVGPSNEQGPPMNPPLGPPAWWAEALITDVTG